MDAEFWSSRVTASRRQSALQADQYFCLDDLDGRETRVDFLCPYCYVEYDIVSLCNHLEDEHSCEPSNAACPICAVNVGNDIVGHITSQHCHLFKIQRRKRHLKGRALSSTLGIKEQRLHSLLGGASIHMGGPSANDVPDPLISSFISVLPIAESPELTKQDCQEDTSIESSCDDKAAQRTNAPMHSEESKEKIEEGVRQAEFVQQLLLSVMLPDDL
eukprot:TRINITY_DN202_c0_g1_i1.p1 TRINITY_DN202_c0_g1~~TRINITY_DN202_c0_g1_i1.p1  ORF type:complete len:217 (-),score=37.10 TRINITY_DN202_c0_g1_i1:552-1202(-)